MKSTKIEYRTYEKGPSHISSLNSYVHGGCGGGLGGGGDASSNELY